MDVIDLRSDTVTRPTPAMRQAMAAAEVGDDVFGEDPTVNLLQVRVASMFGKEAALFVPSGTMGNELCIKAQTEPGDEIIVDQDSHIFVYETGGPSLLSGVQMRTLPAGRGVFGVDQLHLAVRPGAYYLPRTRLICVENTHGRSGGSVVPLEALRLIREFAAAHGILVHLDGARIWNASVATGIAPAEYGTVADSISVCFSKGLGAPVGSMVAGTHAFIDRARKFRKVFGGGMRQSGILAAAALYALDHHLGRLSEDHANARLFAETVGRIGSLRFDPSSVQTNMVIIDTAGTGQSQTEVLSRLKERGVLLTPEGHSSVRAVFHLDVSQEDAVRAADAARLVLS